MSPKEIIEKIKAIKIGGSITIRSPLTHITSLDIERLGEDSYVLNSMTDGWLSVEVTMSEIEKLYHGSIDSMDLDWE